MTLTLAAEASDTYLIAGFVFFAAAIALVVVELFVPSGGLIGLLSGVAVIASVVAFFKYDAGWGWGSLLLYVVLTPIAAVFVFKLWLHSPLAGRMILGADEDRPGGEGPEQMARGEQARRERLAQLQALIGAEGVTVTSLRPVGTVKIGDQRIDALAESGIITSGMPVVVTDVYDNQIKVREKRQ